MVKDRVIEIDVGRQQQQFYLQVLASCLIKGRQLLVTVSKRKDNTDHQMLYIYVYRLFANHGSTGCVGRLKVERRREIGFGLEIYCMQVDDDEKYLIMKTEVEKRQQCHIQVLRFKIGGDGVEIVNVGMGVCRDFSLNQFYGRRQNGMDAKFKQYFGVLRDEGEFGYEIVFGKLRLFRRDLLKEGEAEKDEGKGSLKVFSKEGLWIGLVDMRVVTILQDLLWVQNNGNDFLKNCLSTGNNLTICALNMVENYMYGSVGGDVKMEGKGGLVGVGDGRLAEDSMMLLKCFRKYLKVDKIGDVNWGFIFAQVYQYQNNVPEIHVLNRKTLDIIYLCQVSQQSRPIFYFNSLHCSFQIFEKMIIVREMNEKIIVKHKFESIWGEQMNARIDEDALVLCSLDMVYLVFADEGVDRVGEGEEGEQQERTFMVM